MEKALRGFGYLIFSNFASAFISLASAFFLLNYLSITEFGAYSLYLSIIAITGSLFDMGIKNVVIADAARAMGESKPGAARALLFGFFKYELLLAVFFVAAIAALAVVLGFFGDARALPLGILALAIAFYAGSNVLSAFLHAHARFGSLSLLSIAANFFELILIAAFVVFLNMGLVGALLSYSLSIFLASLLLLPTLAGALKPLLSAREERGVFRAMLASHGKYSVGSSIVKPLSDYAPLWILQFTAGLDAVAVFAAAFKFLTFLFLFFSPFENLFLPLIPAIYSARKAEFKRMLTALMKYSLVYAFGIFVFAYLSFPVVIPVLFAKYVPSISVFSVISPVILAYGFSVGHRSLFFAYKAQKQLLYTYAAQLAAIVVLGVPLALYAGLAGLSFAFLLSMLFAALFRYYLLAYHVDRKLRISFSELASITAYDESIMRRMVEKISAWAAVLPGKKK